jgi:hypothetical protein
MSRAARVGIGVIGTVLVAVLAVIGLNALWKAAKSHLASPDCSVASFDLDSDQASVAATMTGEVTKFVPALPERAVVLVLAAGLQESKLRNLPPGAGDRDSVGVLQQRPSQGWGGGDAAKLNDVGEATREFLVALVKVPGWRTQPLADVVQAVQISADGSLYAQHEPEATALADALQGHRAAGISCQFDPPTQVATPTRVAQLVSADLPINPPRTSATSVTVPGARWQTAAWFVAYADQLGIDQVAYDRQTWTRAHGWKPSTAPATQVVATMYQKS